MSLYAKETFVNATAGHRFSETEPYETRFEERGDLYRACLREYGRCSGKMYRDRSDGPPETVGWVFESRDRYEDTGETYLREVWVEVLA